MGVKSGQGLGTERLELLSRLCYTGTAAGWQFGGGVVGGNCQSAAALRWAGAVVSDGGDWQSGCHPAAFLIDALMPQKVSLHSSYRPTANETLATKKKGARVNALAPYVFCQVLASITKFPQPLSFGGALLLPLSRLPASREQQPVLPPTWQRGLGKRSN